MVQSVQHELSQQTTKWTLEMAQNVSSVVKKTFDPSYGNYPSNGDIEGSVAVLELLLCSMAEWSDNICYAVLVDIGSSQDNSKNLLNMLITLGVEEDAIKSHALLGVSIALRALDRIQQVTVLDPKKTDTAWWLSEESINMLAKTSIDILLK